MNFSTSTHSRNPVLRAGLRGTAFSTSLIVKPELVSNTNNNINGSGSNDFLTISKSRVPDIQMINKYYGLVPKKFVINARSDYSSKQSTKLRARTAHSFDEDISQSLLDERILSKGKIKEIHDDSKVSTSPTSSSGGSDKKTSQADGDELVAKKMSVEKHKKWKRMKDCGRSLSMMDNCENMGTTVGSNKNKDRELDNADRLDIQRVIKIDLNNMKWEESYQEKTKTECRDRQIREIEKGNSLSSNSTTLEPLNNIKNNLNQNANNSNSDSVGNSNKPKKGSLRKTISFDEQIIRSSVEGTGSTDAEKGAETQKLTRRPMTASGRTSAAYSPVPPASAGLNPCQKVPGWTNRNGQSQSASDRRLKFQRSFSIYQGSIDNGESENEQELSETNNQSNLFLVSQKPRESRKSLSLHVQPPPEVSTMISLMNPPPAEEDLQTEIDKVASIINDVHSKIAQVEVKLTPDEPIVDKPNNVITKCEESHPTESIIEATTIETTTVTAVSTLIVDEPPTASHLLPGRKVLKKAASISCENELLPRDPDKSQGKQANHKIRPQTSKAKTSVSFANTTNTRLIPSRSKTNASNFNTTTTMNPSISNLSDAAGSASSSEKGQSQASANRKILIKKALIEINQSSINLGRKLNHTRPKTAPTPEKKNSPLSAHHQGQKRQPLKVRSPPIKPIGGLRKCSTLNSKMETRISTKEGSPEPVKDPSPPDPEPEPSPPKVRVIPRPSFSMIDSVLHGFGPDFHDEVDEDGSPILASYINSKKREECLKIYEKMMKKGCAVKLETIFRGMMTPSEYRIFLQETALAEKSSVEANGDENINYGDAGVSMANESGVETTT